ncbi:hypothetical protein EX30DRAFT_374262 [Ascodesmis nigricans]|uniref:Methyltransferase type 11 domain-containing protein n=1 Tax=Ascodesmis nigricans TaxID=341454 RepID=A0A4S2MLJ9_9PEZI|nr:hypothetical protein EX30DRAFT_374262 [Ascodesmis nigricans]
MRQAPPLVVHEFSTPSSAVDRRRHRRRRSNNITPGGHPRIFKRLHHSSPKPSDIVNSSSLSPWTTHSFAHHILIARVESPPPSPTPPPISPPRSFSRHSLFPNSPDSVPRFSMFRLGSRAKSPRRTAASTVTSTPQNVSPYASNTAPPPPSSAGNYAQSISPTSQVAPWSVTGPGDSMSTSPRNSSSRRSAPGSAGAGGAGGAGAPVPHGFAHANNNNTPGVIPRKKSHSPSSSLSNSIITPTSATSPHNVIPEVPSMPLQKSSKSFLGRRLGKSQQQEPEFDPTTFRKHRTRPAGPRGADAVYQEYDDLFRDDDDDDDELETELDEGYDNRNMDSGIESNEDLLLHEGHHHQETQQQPARPRYSRSQHSADRLQQGAPPRLFPRSSSLASLNQSSPPREPVRAPTSSPSTTISPFPPAAKTWPHPLPQRAINTTTPPRSTAPSVDESLDHLPPPPSAIGAPPTPPLPSATRQNYLSIDTNTVRDDISGLHQRFPTPPPQGTPPTPPPSSLPPHMRTTDLRTQERIIPESLGVDIPSPTLFLPTSVGERWGDSPGSAEPPYTPLLLPTTYDPGVAIASARPFGDSATRVPLRIDTGASPNPAATSTLEIDTIRESGEFEPSLSARHSNGSHEGSRGRSVEPRPKKAPSTRTRSGTVSSIISVSGGNASTVSTEPESATTVRQDTAHLRAFRDFIKASGNNDAFVSRGPRYEAFQAQRICTHLPGDEGSSRTTTITTSASSTDLAATAKESGASKKRKATPSAFPAPRDPAEEIKTALWALMALRWLNFGKVLLSPAHGMLLAASAKTLTRRATMKHDDRAAKMLAEATSPGSRRGSGAGVPWKSDHDKRRVLDLGGMPVADWGWHCAVDYPRAQVITVTTPLPIPIPDTLRGPRNHHHITVPTLTTLPFPDNHFDVVSARTLFLQLHTPDFDPCLTECLRILKPGGYLEFTVIDHDIINAGPLASDLAARFAARLREEDRDPEPSRLWIKRLDTAGFEDVKRMWSVLPMAATPRVPKTSKSSSSLTSLNRPGSQGTITTSKVTVTGRALDPAQEELRRKMRAWEGLADVDPDIPPESDDDEENNTGSTKDVAGITGLVGGWCWEKWVHSVGMKEEKMVGRVMEEAKGYGSGWRCLMGYARKPVMATTSGGTTPV